VNAISIQKPLTLFLLEVGGCFASLSAIITQEYQDGDEKIPKSVAPSSCAGISRRLSLLSSNGIACTSSKRLAHTAKPSSRGKPLTVSERYWPDPPIEHLELW
jgi:hypothetical protein